jgi:hypothetical protein
MARIESNRLRFRSRDNPGNAETDWPKWIIELLSSVGAQIHLEIAVGRSRGLGI